MKNIVKIAFIIAFIFLLANIDKKVMIPYDSIRYRIIADSNSRDSQNIKWKANEKILPVITNIMNESTSINNTRYNIKKSISEIDKSLALLNIKYQINYGNNYFPPKEYKGITYDEGNYESLVITLGEGLGDNWWCVLFPPLCLLEATPDFSENVNYESYVKKIINKYL